MKLSLFIGAVWALVSYALYLTFLVVPNEKFMGAVQRIFYFHVPAAFAGYLSLGILLIGALGYLATHSRKFDALQRSAAEVSLLFISLNLFTGMIWGNAAWGTPFTLEPRLVSSLLLWLLLLSLNVFRFFGDSPKLPTHLAALGILTCLTVPVVIYSIKLLPQFQQLHPQVVQKGGLADETMRQTFYTASFAIMGLGVALVWLRYKVEWLYQQVTIAKRERRYS